MKKKNIFQILILLIIFVISAFTYNKYFKAENLKKTVVVVENDNQNETFDEKITSSKERNIIKDIKYFNEDINGNKFTIQAKKGEINQNDVDLIARHYFKAVNAPDSGKPSSISINDFMKQLSNDSVLLIGQHRKQ